MATISYLVDCPNHEGFFDCTPFCDICEGEQEFDPRTYCKDK
jgi:hypothetical protein